MASHEYYSRAEAAAYLGLSIHTLVEYHARGTGPKFFKSADSRTGHAIYRLRDLRNWNEKRKAKAARTASRPAERSGVLANKSELPAPYPQAGRSTLAMQRKELHRLINEAIKDMRVNVKDVKESLRRKNIARINDSTGEQIAEFKAEFPQVCGDTGGA